MRPFFVINCCETHTESISVSVNYAGTDVTRSDQIEGRGGCACLCDNRPESDLNTVVDHIFVGDTELIKDGPRNFLPATVYFDCSGKKCKVIVTPITDADKDRNILGVIMQDGSKNPYAKKDGKVEAITGKHFGVLNNTSCPKDPLSVVVVYEGNYPVPGTAPRGKFNDIPDNRPTSDPLTDVVDIWVEDQQIRQRNGIFVRTLINISYDDCNYQIEVIPYTSKPKRNKDRNILGIEMQDGNLIEGEKKAKKKAKKTAKKKVKKSGSKTVKTKKAGKKTKSRK